MTWGVYRIEQVAGGAILAGNVGRLGVPRRLYRVVAAGGDGAVVAERRDVRRDDVKVARVVGGAPPCRSVIVPLQTTREPPTRVP